MSFSASHLKLIPTPFLPKQSITRRLTQKTNVQSASPNPDSYRIRFLQHINSIKPIALPWELESKQNLEYGSGFLRKNSVLHLLPSFEFAKTELSHILQKQEGDLNILRIHYIETPFSEKIDNSGRTNYGLSHIHLNIEQKSQRDDSVIFLNTAPHTEALILEASAVLHKFTEKTVLPTSICASFVKYNLTWTTFINDYHKDGAPALQMPLISQGCFGKTSFVDSVQNPLKTISANDSIALTDNSFYHATVVKKLPGIDRFQNCHRLVLTIRNYY